LLSACAGRRAQIGLPIDLKESRWEMSMLRSIHLALMTVTLIVAFGSSSFAQAPQGQRIGALTCRLSPSIGLIIGSQQRMACRFQPDGPFPPESYAGVLNRLGLDIGVSAGGVLGWGVFASTTNPGPGALAGVYGGASGAIGVGLGAGANVLFGGSGSTISLQPLSLQGTVSLNVALGVAGLTLTWVP
jgi:Protein of unknown function (DUF992)